MSFSAKKMADTALSYPSLAITGDAFHHFSPLQHTHF